MQKYFKYGALVIFLLSVCAHAGWQVTQPESLAPREPFFEAGAIKLKKQTAITSATVVPKPTLPTAYSNAAFPSQLTPNGQPSLGQTTPIFAISLSGSLKENLERIMSRYHWRVIWKSPYDYNFDGRVTGASLPNVVEKLLKPFPLQAVMYMSNRTVTVIPR